MKSLFRSFLAAIPLAFVFLCFTSCTPDQLAAYSGYDLFKFEGPKVETVRIGGHFTHRISVVKTPTTYTLTLGDYNPDKGVDGKFTPYVGIDWKIVDENNILPLALSVTFDPVRQTESQVSTKMTISFNGTEDQVVSGSYPIKIAANKSTFDNAKTINLTIILDFPPPVITATFELNDLVIAPGETKTNMMTVSGIKENQRFSMNPVLTAPIATMPTISSSNPVLSTANNTTTFTVSVPAEAIPNADGLGYNIYPTFINTGKPIDFSGDRNGFELSIAGYVVAYVDPLFTVHYGDTVVINTLYVVRGNGTFVPKLIPPTSIPADRIVITQSVTPLPNTHTVQVRYGVFFKDNPNGNVNLTLGGDISYGKAVPKQIVVAVR